MKIKFLKIKTLCVNDPSFTDACNKLDRIVNEFCQEHREKFSKLRDVSFSRTDHSYSLVQQVEYVVEEEV